VGNCLATQGGSYDFTLRATAILSQNSVVGLPDLASKLSDRNQDLISLGHRRNQMLLRFLTRFCYIHMSPKVNLSDETTPAEMDYALAPSEHGSAKRVSSG
jgi:hypothetical protein